MISGEHLGELCRQILVSLVYKGSLLAKTKVGQLKRPLSFTTTMVCEICSDMSHGCTRSATGLNATLDINVSEADMKIIRRVCEIVVDRAALLIGCALAATIAHVKQRVETTSDPVVVAIDGSAYIKFDRLRKAIDSETSRVLHLAYGREAPRFKTLPYLGGSSLGAAVLEASHCAEGENWIYTDQFPELKYLDY